MRYMHMHMCMYIRVRAAARDLVLRLPRHTATLAQVRELLLLSRARGQRRRETHTLWCQVEREALLRPRGTRARMCET